MALNHKRAYELCREVCLGELRYVTTSAEKSAIVAVMMPIGCWVMPASFIARAAIATNASAVRLHAKSVLPEALDGSFFIDTA